jgi:PAS domain S-box-containing protein
VTGYVTGKATADGSPGTDDRQLLNALLATTIDQAILVVDATCRVFRANAGAERLLGRSSGDLVGRPVAAFLRPEAEGTGSLTIDQLLGAGTDSGRMRTLVGGDGAALQVLLSIGALLDETGSPQGAVIVAHEIQGERRAADAMRRAFEREHSAADRLRELSRIKDDFVANVSHELRTPLTTVVGNTEMLLDGDAGPLTGPQERLLGAVGRNARRLQLLVGDLLMLSRIQAGGISMTLRPVVVQDVVRRAVSTVTAQTGEQAAVRLDLHLPTDPLVVDGDPDELARMVGNVLGNAFKFTPAGGVVAMSVGADDSFVRIEVADTGIGIPAGEIDSVFDGFFRSSRSQRNESPGTGLGLTIARSIADRHSGAIEISVREPAGTSVEIRLPRPHR